MPNFTALHIDLASFVAYKSQIIQKTFIIQQTAIDTPLAAQRIEITRLGMA